MRTFGKTLAVALLAAGAAGFAAPSPAAAQQAQDQNGHWLRNQLNTFLGNQSDSTDAERRAYEEGRQDASRQRRAEEQRRRDEREAYGSTRNHQGDYHYSWRDHVGPGQFGERPESSTDHYGRNDNTVPYGERNYRDYGARNNLYGNER